jgi:nucleoside-diphosphate-sugar epimerase
MIKSGKGFVVGNGKNVWHEVHVQDLTDLYVLLGEAAAGGGPPATWNEQGYYLAENGSFVWGDILKAIAQNAHGKGYLPKPTVEAFSAEEIKQVFAFGDFMVGSNSRGESLRARNLLGWSPHRPSLKDEIPAIVDIDARTIGRES